MIDDAGKGVQSSAAAVDEESADELYRHKLDQLGLFAPSAAVQALLATMPASAPVARALAEGFLCGRLQADLAALC